jgi:hypothetical protein
MEQKPPVMMLGALILGQKVALLGQKAPKFML